jgi:hypothetical protein
MGSSLFFTWFVASVTRWVPHVEQELLTLLEHLSSPQVFSEVFCVMVCRSLFVYLYFLTIVLSVLQITAFDYPFDKNYF